jgi:hypothetical protein
MTETSISTVGAADLAANLRTSGLTCNAEIWEESLPSTLLRLHNLDVVCSERAPALSVGERVRSFFLSRRYIDDFGFESCEFCMEGIPTIQHASVENSAWADWSIRPPKGPVVANVTSGPFGSYDSHTVNLAVQISCTRREGSKEDPRIRPGDRVGHQGRSLLRNRARIHRVRSSI